MPCLASMTNRKPDDGLQAGAERKKSERRQMTHLETMVRREASQLREKMAGKIRERERA